jgi:hypothetical protein
LFPLFATSVSAAAGIVDTGGKFATGINNISGTDGKMPLVLLIPVANLTPVVHLDLRISPWIFETIRNDPNVIFRGLGEDDSRKNLVKLSL